MEGCGAEKYDCGKDRLVGGDEGGRGGRVCEMGGSEDVVGEEDGRLGTGSEIGRLELVERLLGELEGGVV